MDPFDLSKFKVKFCCSLVSYYSLCLVITKSVTKFLERAGECYKKIQWCVQALSSVNNSSISSLTGGSNECTFPGSKVKSCIERALTSFFAGRTCIFHAIIFLDVLLGVF